MKFSPLVAAVLHMVSMSCLFPTTTGSRVKAAFRGSDVGGDVCDVGDVGLMVVLMVVSILMCRWCFGRLWWI